MKVESEERSQDLARPTKLFVQALQSLNRVEFLSGTSGDPVTPFPLWRRVQRVAWHQFLDIHMPGPAES